MEKCRDRPQLTSPMVSPAPDSKASEDDEGAADVETEADIEARGRLQVIS